MSLDLVDNVFEPVFQHLKNQGDYLAERIPLQFGMQRGLEKWFQSIVTSTLKGRGYQVTEYVRGDAPEQRGKIDVGLRYANAEVLLELKAANDCRVRYLAGIETDGWVTKYVEQYPRPSFAGCLFLGCASNHANFIEGLAEMLNNPKMMRDHDIQIAQFRPVAASGEFDWVLGLLVTAYGRKFVPSVGE